MNKDKHCSEIEKAVAVALNCNKPYTEAVNEGFLYLLNAHKNSCESKKTLKSVYVLETDTGLIKIGISTNPDRRIALIESASGFSIVKRYIASPCVNASKIEKEAHRHFAHVRKKRRVLPLCFFRSSTESN